MNASDESLDYYKYAFVKLNVMLLCLNKLTLPKQDRMEYVHKVADVANSILEDRRGVSVGCYIEAAKKVYYRSDEPIFFDRIYNFFCRKTSDRVMRITKKEVVERERWEVCVIAATALSYHVAMSPWKVSSEDFFSLSLFYLISKNLPTGSFHESCSI